MICGRNDIPNIGKVPPANILCPPQRAAGDKGTDMWNFEAEQFGIRCSIIRGGTSKGVYFHENDLPGPGADRDQLLLRIMGTPDVLQIDGLGGSHLITSKIAIIGPPTIPGADLDYTFGQVDLDRPVIDYSANCGNISAGVGPFAIDVGLVRIQQPVTAVRIHNTNTGKIIVANVPVAHGRAKVKGDCAIGGVPGTGAQIFMDYRLTVGAKTGTMLPTGNRTDMIELEDGTDIEVTICDVANTIVFCRAGDIGLNGKEGPDQINNNMPLLDRMRELRGKAAQMIGFCSSWQDVETQAPLLPLLYFVAPPTDFTTLNGAQVEAGSVDLLARQMFMNRCHEAMAGTGSMCIAAASRITGSIVNQQLRVNATSKPSVAIGHPSGVMNVRCEYRAANNVEGIALDALGFPRTARKIMDGTVYVPTGS